MEHPIAATLAAQERSGSWLARRTGKSVSYVNRVINRERRPSEDFKRRAADALNVPITLLFPEEEAA